MTPSQTEAWNAAWQPIETAPKDGTEILVSYGRQNHVKKLVRWDRLYGYWASKGNPELGLEQNATDWLSIPDIRAKREVLSPEGGETDDPSANERWQAGCDFALVELCKTLDIDPKSVNWDAATETVDGDVSAIIWNILRARFGDDFSVSRLRSQPTAEDRELVERLSKWAQGWSNTDLGSDLTEAAARLETITGKDMDRSPAFEAMREALRTCRCPRPSNEAPDGTTVEQCMARLECGCDCGAALALAGKGDAQG